MDLCARVTWAISPYYPARIHLVHLNSAITLCRIPAYEQKPLRPRHMVLCPECAITFTALALPADPGPP